MDKQNAIYAYNGILFSLKKEDNSAICHKDEPERHDTKQNKSDTKRNTIFQRQSGKVVTRGWREGELGSYYVTGCTEFQEDKGSGEDGGDSCTTK